MRFIKSYKIFESKNLELEEKLDKLQVIHYTINEDGSIDVDDDVYLDSENFGDTIPFNFNKVNGYFDIRNGSLKTLKNCPKYISRFFDCSYNKLESLEFGSEYVGGDYSCNENQLITLNGCVEEVYGDFECQHNKLTSLEFCPMQVEGDFDCSHNLLIELDRSPFIRKDLHCLGMFKTEPEFNGSCQKLYW